jgi:perosamine synthetase
MRSIWNVASLLWRSNYGAYIGEGPEVKAFEQEFGEKFGFEHVAAVNSGSAALDIAYALAGIGAGDEVIVPVLTHPASALPGVHRGAKIIFADIEEDLNVSVEDIERKITPNTKAIVFVHFAGNNRGLKEVLALAKERNIILIEDAAQAVGSEFWGKGDFTCVSLQAIKTLTSVDGGFIICKDKEMHDRAKRLRWFGYDRERKQKEGDTDIAEPGFKYHMSDVTAAIGRGNMQSINTLIAQRHALGDEYKKHGINASVWFAHTLTPKREELMAHLKEHGVHAGVHHFRNDKYSIFGGKVALPNMDRLESQYMILPLHHGMSVQDVTNICTLIKNFNEIPKS